MFDRGRAQRDHEGLLTAPASPALWVRSRLGAELALESLGLLVLLKHSLDNDCAGLIADLIEVHRHAIRVVEPFPHVVESVAQLGGIDL
jgi:hypothetical protein